MDEKDTRIKELEAEVERMSALFMQASAKLRAPLVWTSNGEAGDGQHMCSICNGETEEAHEYKTCAEKLLESLGSLGEMLVENEDEITRLSGALVDMWGLVHKASLSSLRDAERLVLPKADLLVKLAKGET